MGTYQTLPIDSYLSEIVSAVDEFSNVIVVAEPGAGKTTRVPVALAQNGKRWIVLQPRRWAARMSALRISEEQNFKLGEEVGYQVRFDSKLSKNTRILFMTEGVLLRKLITDPELQGFDGVILDEFHERSLDLDLAVSILKEIKSSLRSDLKIVVMSATLDPTPLEKFFGKSRTFTIAGRVFPVQKKYLGEVSPLRAVKSALEEMERNPKLENGDILIFLPGSYEINRAVSEIFSWVQDEHRNEFEVLPLYASLPENDQKKIFAHSSKRKIICSTNIAETSLTLPNVKVVIDSGWAKVMRTDPQLGQDRLETIRISRASSEQRAGRAGRVSEGLCLRLWTEGEQSQLRHFETPEIHRVHLGQALLFLSDFGVTRFDEFEWFEKPKASMLQFSVRELEGLGLLKDGRLTEDGRATLQYPLGPALAKLMLVSKRLKKEEFGARFAAYLEDRSSDQPVAHGDQLVARLNSLRGTALQNAKQLFGSRQELPELSGNEWNLFEEILLTALPKRVFLNGKLVGRRKITARDRPLPKAGFLLQSIEKTDRGVPMVQAQSWVEVSEASIQRFAKRKKDIYFDEESERIRAVEGLFFEDLEIGTLTDVAVSAAEASALLIREIEKDPVEFLQKNETFSSWWKRVEFFNRNRKDGEAKIEMNWADAVPMIVEGKTKFSQILNEDVVPLFEGGLDRGLVHLLNEWVPERIDVPSGSRIKLDYGWSDQPKLSVRLQEIFGWIETPRLVGGRIPILIELLSPSFKPIQLTQDLRSFWSNAYFEVKKELKARYPRHSWPDDPLTAKPEAKGGRKRH